MVPFAQFDRWIDDAGAGLLSEPIAVATRSRRCLGEDQSLSRGGGRKVPIVCAPADEHRYRAHRQFIGRYLTCRECQNNYGVDWNRRTKGLNAIELERR